ncbi:MAG: four helix bundle protein [Planctomycetes bacterium]|nr:four helix bundle protein [Planctomycetota bacterium]
MDFKKRQAAHEKLKFYQQIRDLRRKVYVITERFAKSHLRLVSQMRDAARSAKQNIREGYKKGTIGEFVHGINISRGSLEELSGDLEDCLEDGLITQDEVKELSGLCHSADYLSSRYIKSVYKMDQEGKWKTPRKRKNKKK